MIYNVCSYLLVFRNTLMLTRVGSLDCLDHSLKPQSVMLTKPGFTFTFAKSRIPIEFVECSVLKDPTVVREWIEKI